MAKSSSTSSSSRFTAICLSIVLGLSAVFFGASEWLIQTHIVPHDHGIKRAQLFHQRPHINTVWGDSQMRDGVNMMDGFMNFSSGSQTYSEIDAKIRAYYAETEEPFKVVLQASINNFAAYRDRPDRAEVQHFYVDGRINGPFMITPFFQETAWRYWKNFFENGMQIKGSDARFNEDGSTSKFGDYATWEESRKIKHVHENVEAYLPLPNPKELKAYDDLKNLFEFLKGKGAQICLVTTPMHNDAKALLLQKDETKTVMNVFKELSKEFDIRYINFLNRTYSESYFDDTSHLNHLGAEIYTREVNSKCF